MFPYYKVNFKLVYTVRKYIIEDCFHTIKSILNLEDGNIKIVDEKMFPYYKVNFKPYRTPYVLCPPIIVSIL